MDQETKPILLTEQEIRSIMRSVKEIGENSDRALILAAESTVIEKIKAQGAEVFIGQGLLPIVPEDLVKLRKYEPGLATLYDTPLFRLPEGDL